MSETQQEKEERLARAEKWSKMAEDKLQEIKVGDLVTGYDVGIHRVVQIAQIKHADDLKDKWYYSRLEVIVDLERVLDTNFKKVSKRKSRCNISYCKKVTKELIDEWLKEEMEKIDRMKALRDEVKEFDEEEWVKRLAKGEEEAGGFPGATGSHPKRKK